MPIERQESPRMHGHTPTLHQSVGNKKKASHNVPEQLRGFNAQATRMASLLMEAPEGTWVSLEHLGDVAQENADGSIIAVESKDTEATNPVTDRSVQMWKTFANWARDVRERRLDAQRTTFELYVSRKVTGKLVSAFAAATSKSAANDAFIAARSLLWGDSPKFLKKDKVADTLRPHLDEVFGAGEAAFRAVIERFRFTCSSVNPEVDLLNAVKRSMVLESDDIILEVLVDIHGWLKKRVDEQLRERKAPTIARDDFLLHLKGSWAKLKPGGALPDLGGKGPTPSDIAKLLCERFVQQMDIIKLDDDSQNRAMAYLFKARTARTKWGARGDALVHDDDVKAFEEDLQHTWRNIKTEVFSDPLRPDEELRGRLLLSKCELHTRLVEGKTVPGYFVPGCFHELANKLAVGWHPQFEILLRKFAA